MAENILESDQSNGGYFAAVAGDVEQTFEIDQFAGISNEIEIATNDDAFGFVWIVNFGPLELENASVVVLSSVHENEALGFGVGGNVDQSTSVDQVAGLWNEIGIDSGNTAVSVPALIANESNVDASNFSVANLVAVEGNDAYDGLNGNVDQSILLSQAAGVWNELDVTGQNAGGALLIANGGDLYARNNSVEGILSEQTMVGGGSFFRPGRFPPSSVDQTPAVDQLAGIWNAVRVHAEEAVEVDAGITNDGVLRAENTSTGILTAEQFNDGLLAVAGNVSQAATLRLRRRASGTPSSWMVVSMSRRGQESSTRAN